MCNMKRFGFWLTVMATMTTADLLSAGEVPEFQAREFKGSDGGTLLYRLLVPPKYQPADSQPRHPLLIFLHGAGERGSDNQAQLKHGRPFMESVARDYGCFVLAPQCPSGQKWVDVDWFARDHRLPQRPSEPMRALLELLPQLQREFRIDPDRLYVMGLSMGGYGTWGMIQRNPDKFAAAVPICGGADASCAEQIKHVPVWCFHGDKDGAVPVTRSRQIIESLRQAGGNPKYTEYPGVGHNSWTPAFADPELPKWLFAQKRKKSP
jgi:poly(hydroxyalkanoate) depolymerase family esterase